MNENSIPHEPLTETFDSFGAGWVKRVMTSERPVASFDTVAPEPPRKRRIPDERPKPYESSTGAKSSRFDSFWIAVIIFMFVFFPALLFLVGAWSVLQ